MRIRIALLVTALIVASSICAQTDLSATFTEPWRQPINNEFVTIGRTLVKNGLTNCGEYYVKQSIHNNAEFLVACSPDSLEWTYHIVNTKTQEVLKLENEAILNPPARSF